MLTPQHYTTAVNHPALRKGTKPDLQEPLQTQSLFKVDGLGLPPLKLVYIAFGNTGGGACCLAWRCALRGVLGIGRVGFSSEGLALVP